MRTYLDGLASSLRYPPCYCSINTKIDRVQTVLNQNKPWANTNPMVFETKATASKAMLTLSKHIQLHYDTRYFYRSVMNGIARSLPGATVAAHNGLALTKRSKINKKANREAHVECGSTLTPAYGRKITADCR